MEFRDLKKQYIVLKEKIDEAVIDVMSSTQYIMGPSVIELEKKFADYIGVKHCISCANGTDALTLAMMALDIKKGEAVFVPTFTFFATAEVVSFEDATPIFVDVDEKTFNIDAVKLEEAINNVIKEGLFKPRAIIPVDLFGLPADYESIEKIAKKYNLDIIEDGAQGFGGNLKDKKACSFGKIATTSFFPAKPLGCYGDGGAIFLDDDELAEKIKSFRVHGKGTFKYDNVRVGMNSRLDSIQAAILNIKFDEFIASELKNVNKNAELYSSLLKDLVETPFIPDGYYSSWAQYVIKLPNKKTRDNLQLYLKQYDIPTMIYYPKPLHKQTAYIEYKQNYCSLEVSEKLSQVALALPIHPYQTKEDIVSIVSKITEFLNQNNFSST